MTSVALRNRFVFVVICCVITVQRVHTHTNALTNSATQRTNCQNNLLSSHSPCDTHRILSRRSFFFLPCWLLFASKFVVLLLTHCSSAEFSSVHRAYFLVFFFDKFRPAYAFFPSNSDPRWVSLNFRINSVTNHLVESIANDTQHTFEFAAT